MHKKHTIKRLINFTLAMVVVLSVFAAALPQSAQAAVCEEEYIVKPGETIGKIAKKYDTTINRLAKTNNLTSPYALTAGQTICIPDTSPASANATWTPTYTNANITIEGSAFKKSWPLILKVRENDTSDWYKLGKFTSDKNGVVDESFKTPKDLLSKPSVMVCVKDAGTDALTCKKVFRQ